MIDFLSIVTLVLLLGFVYAGFAVLIGIGLHAIWEMIKDLRSDGM